ncbi:hypothetical protein Tco_0213546 [Tanacetum coccineum]
MTTLQFTDTHNLVMFLSKLAESAWFEQIVDSLNANPIRYALTINPTIYTSCIEQFWATSKVKTVNGEVQLQALVDGKKIIVTESSIRRDLQLNDEEGTDCLPNATIFEELTRMGYEKHSQKLTFDKAFFSPQWKFFIHTILQCLSVKTTAWNELSSTIASAIILFLEKQLEGMQSHKRIYVTLSHTKKIFGNIRRVGKGFSGRETPLFSTMMVQAQKEQGEGLAMPTDPHHTPTIIQPSTSQPQLKQRSKRPKRKDTEVPQPSGPTTNVAGEAVNEEMDDNLERDDTTATSLDAEQDMGNINKTQSKATLNEPSSLGTSSGSGPRRQDTMGDTIARTRLKLNELMEFCIKLQQRVLDLKNTKTTQAQEITSLKLRVKKLEKKGGSRTHKLKSLYKVGRSAKGRYGDEDMFAVNDLEGDEVIVETEVPSKDVNLSVDEVTLAQALAVLKCAKPKAVKVILQEPEQGTITTTTNAITVTAASTRSKAKGLVIHEQKQATTPIVSSQQPSQLNVQDKEEEANIVSWDNVQAMIDADYQMAQQIQAEEQEKLNLQQESIKKQKVDEDKETAELQRLIKVFPDKEEVAIDAIPLATKPPSIIDWNIHKEGKKSYYQIIRADGSSKMYLNSNSYLRDILGDILGKDMYYPLTRFVSHIVDLDLSKLSIVLQRLVRSYTKDLQVVSEPLDGL